VYIIHNVVLIYYGIKFIDLPLFVLYVCMYVGMYVIGMPTSNIEVFGPEGSNLCATSHVVECCEHCTSVDGKGTSILLDQKLCYQMSVSIYVNMCVCVCVRARACV
jgi:hypothetical protein